MVVWFFNDIVGVNWNPSRRRTMQDIANAKKEGMFKGRREDVKRNNAILGMLKSGQTWANIIGCSRSTLARATKRKALAAGS